MQTNKRVIVCDREYTSFTLVKTLNEHGFYTLGQLLFYEIFQLLISTFRYLHAIPTGLSPGDYMGNE